MWFLWAQKSVETVSPGGMSQNYIVRRNTTRSLQVSFTPPFWKDQIHLESSPLPSDISFRHKMCRMTAFSAQFCAAVLFSCLSNFQAFKLFGDYRFFSSRFDITIYPKVARAQSWTCWTAQSLSKFQAAWHKSTLFVPRCKISVSQWMSWDGWVQYGTILTGAS